MKSTKDVMNEINSNRKSESKLDDLLSNNDLESLDVVDKVEEKKENMNVENINDSKETDEEINMDFTTKSQAIDNAFNSKTSKAEEITKIENKYGIKKEESFTKNFKSLLFLNKGIYENLTIKVKLLIFILSLFLVAIFFILKDLISFFFSNVYIYGVNNFGQITNFLGLFLLIGLLTITYMSLMESKFLEKAFLFFFGVLIIFGIVNIDLFLFCMGFLLIIYSISMGTKKYSKQLSFGYYFFGLALVL